MSVVKGKSEYVKFSEIPFYLGISKGDKILINSAMRDVINVAEANGDKADFNDLIDAFIEAVGENGTVMFPTYNWDWCSGKTFDYRSTPSQVGALSQTALERDDFVRTKHPIYSFAVWGGYSDELKNFDNISAFGGDSPFQFLYENHVKNIFVNCKFSQSFTFVHFVEEQNLPLVSYRYMKDFRSDYIDERGQKTEKVYSMYVRSYAYDVEELVDGYEDDWLKAGIQRNYYINGLKYISVDLTDTYPIILQDIRDNYSRKLCSRKGQNGTPITPKDGMYGLVEELYPLCRSITGDGFRNSLSIVKSYIPDLSIHSVASGTKVFDWIVPREWNITDAYVEDEDGNKVINFKENNLHVVGYSAPIDKMVSLSELKGMIYTIEDMPDAIPYVTSYYNEISGFCMTYHQLLELKDGNYHAVIKSSFDENGVLNYGEIYIPGETQDEILFSTYLCHPSMANNECSGPAVTTYLARYVREASRHYSYRFLFLPETIGVITFLSQNYEKFELRDRVVAGFVVNCVGDDRTYSFVSTRYGDTLTDKLLRYTLGHHYPEYKEYSFLERGSDERQYNAPGIDLPVCSVCRSLFHNYPEYHTSADNLDLVTPLGLVGSYELLTTCIDILENNKRYKTTVLCEPMMGSRGLYSNISKRGSSLSAQNFMDFLAYADGKNDLIDIGTRTGIAPLPLIKTAQTLRENNLIAEQNWNGR